MQIHDGREEVSKTRVCVGSPDQGPFLSGGFQGQLLKDVFALLERSWLATGGLAS